MVRSTWAIAAAGLFLASPAVADPGPHDHQTVAELLSHVLTDGFHVGCIVALAGLALAGLGLWSVIRSAREGFRR